MAIKNVVFDVGNVLIDFRYKEYMRDLGFDDETVEFLSKNMVETEYWNELDRGTQLNADAIEKFTEMFPGLKNEVVLFWNHLENIVREYDYSEGLIKSIKDSGYSVYILSNYPIETADIHYPTFKFMKHTDGHIISGYEKIIKPDVRIYKLLQERFDITFEESVFVDDRPVNLEPARELGMKTIRFTDCESLIKSLSDLGVVLSA